MYYKLKQHTQSELENEFLKDCVTVGLRVVPQYKVGNIHADFGIPDMRTVIEIDSKMYHSTEKQKDNDRKRDEIYSNYFYNIIRIPGSAVLKYGESIVRSIKNGSLTGCYEYFGVPEMEAQDVDYEYDPYLDQMV